MQDKLDLYTDYLLTTVHQATATGLSRLVDGAISHDEITRLLSENEFGSRDLWKSTKKLIRAHETEDACLIFDDSIIEKKYTDESSLICWHYDHSVGKNVKGVNLLTAFYHSHSSNEELPLRAPVSFELILKTQHFCDLKTKKEKRKSLVTKNELLREMVQQNIHNQLKFKYVLADSWFGSSENMLFVHRKKKFFIFDMKSNRKAVLNEKDRNAGQWTRIDELDISDNTPVKVWLKDLEIPVLLIKQIFINKDQSTGVRFLVSNDFSLSNDDFTTIYKKRWSVEEYHKSLKQNAAIAKSPTRTIKTQSNHLFASILAYVKLEKLKFIQGLNHFAIKSKIYLAANKAAFNELRLLKMKNLSLA
jgi:hypothetical protein